MDDYLKSLAQSSCYSTTDGTLVYTESGDQGSPLAPLSSATLDDKYQIISILGEGGMGTVYRAHHITLNKDVALKTFRATNLTADAWERFQREARAVAKLDNRYVVRVFDFGIIEGNRPYYTMELLEGESLAQRLERSGPLGVDEALKVFSQVAEGLASAHKKGIVHRDLKPANIFLQMRDGKIEMAKLVDFGIAKLADGNSMDDQRLTATGTVFGSPLYMSPEQSLGRNVDERSDVYSLGCAFFQALTGVPPFIGENAFATILSHQRDIAPRLSQKAPMLIFPSWLEVLIASMLEKRIDKRTASVQEIIEVIAQNCNAARTVAPQAIIVQEKDPPARSSQANRRTVPAVATAVLVLLAGCLALALNLLPSKKAKELPSSASSTISSAARPASQAIDEHTTDLPFKIRAPQILSKELVDRQIAHMWFKLRNETITYQNLTAIAQSSATGIDFYNCKIDNLGLRALRTSKITRIKIIDTNLDDNGLYWITQCPGITYLKIPQTKVTEAGLTALTRLKDLTLLDFSGMGTTDTTLKNLARLPKLETLHITRATQITNAGLEALEKTKLKNLAISIGAISDENLAPIAKIASLQKLEIPDSMVTESGIKTLCQNSKNIRTIDVTGCRQISIAALKRLEASFHNVRFENMDTHEIDALVDQGL